MVYIIIANVSLLIFFGIYILFLRNLTFFYGNRIYLLSALGLSFILPLFQFVDFSSHQEIYKSISAIDLSAVEVVYTDDIVVDQSGRSFIDGVVWVYGIGCALFFIRFILALFKIKNTFNISKSSSRSFSFFHLLFVGDQVSKRDKIWEHEYVHMKQGHSYDILFVELIRVFNWFNPILYYYRKELKFQHECIADNICATNNKTQYAELLVANAMDANVNSLFHEFSNQSLLKKRIMMLFKNKTKKGYYILYLLSLPFLFIITGVALAANPSLSGNLENTILYDVASPILKSVEEDNTGSQNEPESLLSSAAETVQDTSEDKVFIDTEVLPMPKGGMDAFRKWIGMNYVYSPEAIDNHVSGRVKVAFIVEKDGSLSDFQSIQDLGYGTSEELIRLLKSSEKWSPAIQNGKAVRFKYTLPLELHVSGPDSDPVMTELPDETKEIDPVTIVGYASQQEAKTEASSGDIEENKQKKARIVLKGNNKNGTKDPETAPEPEMGIKEFRQWIGKNYEYPQEAIDAGVKGTIVISFIVEEDGTLSNFEIVKDLDHGTGEEAIKILKESPKWKPGTRNDVPVRTDYVLPITLNLQK